MKFSDGVWQTAEGMGVASPHNVFDLAVSEREVVIEASSCPYRARFEDLNTACFTVRPFSTTRSASGSNVSAAAEARAGVRDRFRSVDEG